MQIRELIETAKDTDRLLSPLEAAERQVKTPKHLSCIINVDTEKTYQTIMGFGGALTESSGYVLASLSAADREAVLKAYFSASEGLGYTFARTHLNSCDFSLGNWACLESRDESLASFSMAMPERYQIPLLKDAFRAAGGHLSLLLSPWSPPAWMKDNNDMNHGGKLLRQYYPLWASYFVRYIDELAKRDIPVWAVSIQNEPEATQIWDSCIWTAREEAEFAVEHLGPALEKAGYGHIKILVWDHNRDRLWERASESYAYGGAEKYIAGAAYHWYSGDQYDAVRRVAEAYPDKLLVFSEGCVEGGPRPGAWFTGERYAHNIINDLNNGCQAWIDWNIALDFTGGPNHVGNLCDAPILVDTEQGRAYYQSSFYYIGHFSRYIRPGARRLGLRMDSWMVPAAVDGRMGNTMEACAARNTDGTISLVVSNRTEADMVYRLSLSGDQEERTLVCPPRGIQTLVLG
ncbi:glycoside hydrolase family 30 protein [Gracilinema caldarium]|uniref:Glucosylceramidase n=2 Tax=Gracilinema caldarium TaxID=215591 RepID=F8F227_GRAC1|nr:glycoside hydrolase family 30 beta sandwich domain-containing protein [Gracilinema caldarium]AEJ20299.1 Glucosylceramidase [Gracilinema caldarium DSM 7334]